MILLFSACVFGHPQDLCTQFKYSQEPETDWCQLGELLTDSVELMVYVEGQRCSWIDSPVRITLLGSQHPKEGDAKMINKTGIRSKKAAREEDTFITFKNLTKKSEKCHYVKID